MEDMEQYRQAFAVAEEVMIQIGVPNPLAKMFLVMLFLGSMGGYSNAETTTTELHRLGQGDLNPAFVTLYKTNVKEAACHCSGSWHEPPALELYDLVLGTKMGGTDPIYCSAGTTPAVVKKFGRPRSAPAGFQLAWKVSNTPAPMRQSRGTINPATDRQHCTVTLKFGLKLP